MCTSAQCLVLVLFIFGPVIKKIPFSLPDMRTSITLDHAYMEQREIDLVDQTLFR